MSTSESLTPLPPTHFPAYPPEAAQFNVYWLEPDRPPSVPCTRRDLYQITLYTSGTACLEHAGTSRRVEAPALVLHHPLAPYACPFSTPVTGFYCLFSADFLHGPGAPSSLLTSPLFQSGADPVQVLTESESAFLSVMVTTAALPYRHRYDLLRTCVQLVLHEALRVRPGLHLAAPSPADRLAGQFFQLLEQQFPISSPVVPLRLHHAEAFATALGVHVNYLNRALRAITGRTTSAHLAERITQEAKALLRHTGWSVAEVADSLSFANATYFTNFFHKHAGLSPTNFRQQHATCQVRGPK